MAEDKVWAVEQVEQQVPHKYQIQLHQLEGQDQVVELAAKVVVELGVQVATTQGPQAGLEAQELVTALLVVQ